MNLAHFKMMPDGVEILQAFDGKYIQFISDLDVCNDGSGPDHGDPSYQSQTAYSPYLNADVDRYVVTPPQVRTGVVPVVIGCQARITDLSNRRWHWAVVGDVGPSDKTGECSYVLAKEINPAITHNRGDTDNVYLYEFWPGVPAVVGNKKYKLVPAG
jgi:hypothetical protein